MKTKTLSKNQILTKYKTKFVSKFYATPILMGVHYRADGAAVMTDRHQMLVIKNAHTLEKPLTIDAKTGEFLEGNFPDVETILARPKGVEVKIESKCLQDKEQALRAAVEVATRIGGKMHPISQLGTNDRKELIVLVEDEGSGVRFELVLAAGVEEKIPNRKVNTSYLHNAISVFIDASVDLTIIMAPEAMTPIMLTDEENYTAIVLPYR